MSTSSNSPDADDAAKVSAGPGAVVSTDDSSPIRLSYRLGGCPVVATFSSLDLAERFRGVFRASETTRVEAPPSIAVQQRGREYTVRVEGEAPLVTMDFVRALEAYEWALTERLMAAVASDIHVHAGGAVGPHGGMLALGRSGAGKSTIAFHWSRMGFRALGDDIVRIDGRGHAAPFPRIFKIPDRVASEAGIDVERTIGWRADCDEVWVEPAAGWSDAAPVCLVAHARFVPGTDTTVEQLPRTALLAALMESVVPSGRAPRAAFETLADVAVRAEGYSVTYGRAEDAATMLAALAARARDT